LEFLDHQSPSMLGLNGHEYYSIDLQNLKPKALVKVEARSESGDIKTFEARCRIDTLKEMDYLQHGGILHYVLRQLF
jgi:aconitate hydratase